MSLCCLTHYQSLEKANMSPMSAEWAALSQFSFRQKEMMKNPTGLHPLLLRPQISLEIEASDTFV